MTHPRDERPDPTAAGEEGPVREARLRPEFAHTYPGMQAGMWYLAASVASAVRHDQAAPPAQLRPLPDTHFEFRGGARGRQHEARTRSSDGPSWLST